MVDNENDNEDKGIVINRIVDNMALPVVQIVRKSGNSGAENNIVNKCEEVITKWHDPITIKGYDLNKNALDVDDSNNGVINEIIMEDRTCDPLSDGKNFNGNAGSYIASITDNDNNGNFLKESINVISSMKGKDFGDDVNDESINYNNTDQITTIGKYKSNEYKDIQNEIKLSSGTIENGVNELNKFKTRGDKKDISSKSINDEIKVSRSGRLINNVKRDM